MPDRGAACPGLGPERRSRSPPRLAGAAGIAVIGLNTDQARTAARRSNLRPGPGVVAARAARHAQVQEMAPAIRQTVDLEAEAAPAATARDFVSFFVALVRTTMHPVTRRIDPDRPACEPSGVARHLGRTCRPSGDDRVPLPVRGRQSTPRHARLRRPV